MEPYKPLAELLIQSRLFPENEVQWLCSHWQQERLPKNTYFQEAGKRCSRIGFLKSGILCSYILSPAGEEVVRFFIEPGQFFTDLDSYQNASPAKLNIQALTDAEVLYITKKDSRSLQEEKPDLANAFSTFAAGSLGEMINTRSFLDFGSAVDKYRHFVKHHPNLARQVPLKFIASYLGITQSSLSRIRREKW